MDLQRKGGNTVFMNSLFNRFVIVLLSLFGVIFFAYQIYQIVYQPYQTQTVQLVNYADEVALEGVVLKDETVIQSDYTGVVKYEYENSQKVLSGATVATVYANQSDLLADNQIETLTRRVELLNQVGSENAATTINASSTITNLQRAQMNLIYDAQMGEYDSLSDDSDTLLEGLLQQQKLLDETLDFSSVTADLNAQISSLQAGMTGSSVEITAPSSGYFTNETDGYETVLNTSMIGTVTVDAVDQLLATQPAADQGQNVGKLMSAAKWYYLAKLSSSDAIRFSEGQTVQLVFHGNTAQTVTATVETVNVDASKDQSAILLSSTVVNGDLMDLRMENAYCIFDSGSGLRVPREAVRVVDGEMGVYVNRNQVVKFKKLDVIYEGSDYLISNAHVVSDAENGIDANDYLSLYDEIILNGNDVYDNMPLS